MQLNRRMFCVSIAGAGTAGLCGCIAGPCERPALPDGISWTGVPTWGEIRTCKQETPESLHGVKVELPSNAASIVSDYRTALDVNFAIRPFRHTGIDIAGDEGATPVIAALDGTVDAARHYLSGGNCVVLYHGLDTRGRDLVTGYFHLDRILVRSGESVRRGDLLGYVGMTGTTAGSVPHLHYNVFSGRGLRGTPFGHYFYDAHVNPHLYWHDGPGKVTMFEAETQYPRHHGATYPVPAERTNKI